MFRLSVALAAIAFAVPFQAQAQAPVAGSITFRGDVSNNGTLQSGSVEGKIGPYRADLAFGGTLSLARAIVWCVDWTNRAPAAGSVDSYYLSTLAVGADLSKTRKNDFARYLKAAWMFEQVAPNGGSYNLAPTRYSAKNVQGSVWEMMDPMAFAPTGNPAGANTGLVDNVGYDKYRYFNVAGDAANTTIASLQYDWYILSDTGSDTYNQEFMVAVARVPEPGSFALVSFGLVALGGVARRRYAARRIPSSN
jgi:hypothetical protein